MALKTNTCERCKATYVIEKHPFYRYDVYCKECIKAILGLQELKGGKDKHGKRD